MKKIITLLCLTTLLLTSCSNDDDVDFDTIAQTIDLVDGVNFIAPEYTILFSFVENRIEVFPSDAIAIFRRDGFSDTNQPIWEPLPTPAIFFDDGNDVFYRYNHTDTDVEIILESADPAALSTEFRQNVVFRIVVIPSARAQDKTLDLTNYEALSSALDINSENIFTISLD